MADVVLKIEDLGIAFGGLHAVDHLNLEVKEKQIYKLTPEGAISLLKDSGKDYSFVDINE